MAFMLDNLISVVLGGVAGGVFGFLSSWRRQHIQNVHSRTIAIYDEFNSQTMQNVRMQVESILDEFPGISIYAVFLHARKNNERDKEAAIQSILIYFEKVVKLTELGLCNKHVLTSLMGRYFSYWCDRIFDISPIDTIEHQGYRELISTASRVSKMRDRNMPKWQPHSVPVPYSMDRQHLSTIE